MESFFTVASAEGTVGLSVVPISEVPEAGKLILIANMFLGRLEIIPFLVMIYIIVSSIFRLRLPSVRDMGSRLRRKKDFSPAKYTYQG